jgi:hypothetical protein
LLRSAGVGAKLLVDVNVKLEGSKRTKLETVQSAMETKARERGNGKPGELCFDNGARDKPVQLLRSVLHGTYTGRVPGVHAMNLAFIALMFALQPFYIGAMLRLALVMIAIDQTFKKSQAIKQRGVGGTLEATYSNICTAINHKREVVLACFAKDKSHGSQDAAMKALAARAKKQDGVGVRTVVTDNPEEDQGWLIGIFGIALQVLCDPFHYLQEFGKSATRRSAKSGLWAMAVSCAFWIANEEDVVADKDWHDKQREKKKKNKGKRKKGRNTGKSNPNLVNKQSN